VTLDAERMAQLDADRMRLERKCNELQLHVDELSEALRELASYVGNGGHNAPDPIDAGVFVAKVRDGIDDFARSEVKRALRATSMGDRWYFSSTIEPEGREVEVSDD